MHQRRIISLLLFILLLPSLATAKINFNPAKVARSEVQMWQAYYAGQYTNLFYSLNRLQRQQFGLNPWQSTKVAYYATRAAVTFRRLPLKTSEKEYRQKVLPHLIRLFTYLKKIRGGHWNATEVAKAELQWWVTRRGPQGKNTKLIGEQIAKVYSLLYGKENKYISRAGYLRAKAARLRDKQSARGNSQWDLIYQLLLQSYQSLKIGMDLV